VSRPPAALSPPQLQGLASAIAETLEQQRRELRAEIAVLRGDVASLRASLAAGDGPMKAVLDALTVERTALDALAADAPRLTGSQLQERLAAMRNRLCQIDAQVH